MNPGKLDIALHFSLNFLQDPRLAMRCRAEATGTHIAPPSPGERSDSRAIRRPLTALPSPA